MKTGILWVSYGRDAEWFRYSAKSFKRNAHGFGQARVLVPRNDVEGFRPLAEPNGIEVVGFDEWPRKGQLHQQYVKCCADIWLPDATHIFHLDSDCLFWRDTYAAEFTVGEKPILPFNLFDRWLKSPVLEHEAESFMVGHILVPGREQYFWKFAVESALGWTVDKETMAWMPMCHIREVYSKLRDVISTRFRKPFADYVRSCRNEYPQSFCEFNSMGAVADRFYKENYVWYPLHETGYPFVPTIQMWSHGGLDREAEFPREVGGKQTPRRLLERLKLND